MTEVIDYTEFVAACLDHKAADSELVKLKVLSCFIFVTVLFHWVVDSTIAVYMVAPSSLAL